MTQSAELVRLLNSKDWLVSRIELINHRRGPGYSLDLNLELSSGADVLSVSFEEVRSYNFTQKSSNIVARLTIADVRDRGWDDVYYEVTESDEQISFICKNIRG